MSEKSKGKAGRKLPRSVFKPGVSGNPHGRQAGVPNKTTTALKEAILLAAELLGDEQAQLDRKAIAKKLRLEESEIDISRLEGGLVRYLKGLFKRDDKVAGALLGRVLPLVVQDGGKAPDAEVMERVERFTTAMDQLRDRAEKDGRLN